MPDLLSLVLIASTGTNPFVGGTVSIAPFGSEPGSALSESREQPASLYVERLVDKGGTLVSRDRPFDQFCGLCGRTTHSSRVQPLVEIVPESRKLLVQNALLLRARWDLMQAQDNLAKQSITLTKLKPKKQAESGK